MKFSGVYHGQSVEAAHSVDGMTSKLLRVCYYDTTVVVELRAMARAMARAL